METVLEQRSYTRLTLALDIMGKIAGGPLNGYHELATVKHQIDLFDTIVIEPADTLTISCTHPDVPCDERNICHKAARLLQTRFNIDQQVRIFIDKNIPVMGGLAGGSANAATVLMMLSRFWKLECSTPELMLLGRELGMDVPFYFLGKTAWDTEAGGECVEIPTDVSLTFVLAFPPFGVSTADAYRGIDYHSIAANHRKTDEMRQFFLANNRSGVVSSIHNDFELSVFRQYPDLMAVKQELINAGCETAVLSGSGSTIFGIARDREHAEEICGRVSYRTMTVASLA